MPNPFYPAAKAAIQPLAAEAGFRSRGRHFYRITNDVVQQFCLLSLRGNYTIRFHISSVYDENRYDAEGVEVCRLIDGTGFFLSNRPQLLVPDPFDPDYRVSLETCVEVCETALRAYLLPWFEQTADSERAFRQAQALGMLAPRGEPRARNCLGFLLALGRTEEAAALLRQEPACEYRELCRAVTAQDGAFLRAYMEQKKAATYAEFKWKPL